MARTWSAADVRLEPEGVHEGGGCRLHERPPAPCGVALAARGRVSWSGHSWTVRPASWGGFPAPTCGLPERRSAAGSCASRSTAPGAAGRAPRSSRAVLRIRTLRVRRQLRSGATRPVGRVRPVHLCRRPSRTPQRDRHRGRQVGTPPRSDEHPVRAAALPHARQHEARHPAAAPSVHDAVGLDGGPHPWAITDGTGTLVSARSAANRLRAGGRARPSRPLARRGPCARSAAAIEIASFTHVAPAL